MILIIGLVVVFGVALYVVSVYNSLTTASVRIKAAISEIGNQLKRQAELIPNLISATKGYLKHEKDIFEMLSRAREQVSEAVKSGKVGDMVSASDSISKMIPQVRAVFESNPQIQGSAVVGDLMKNLTDTADKVSYSRRLLIDLTADYNRLVSVVPSTFVAKVFGFKEKESVVIAESGEHLTVSKEQTATPKVEL